MMRNKSISTPFHVCITPRLFGPGSGAHTPILLHCEEGATRMNIRIQCMKNTPSSFSFAKITPSVARQLLERTSELFQEVSTLASERLRHQASVAGNMAKKKKSRAFRVHQSLFLPTLYGPTLFHIRKIKKRITVKIDTAMTRLILDWSRHPRF